MTAWDNPDASPGLQQLITQHWQSSPSLHQNTNRKSSHLLREEEEKHPLASASSECHEFGHYQQGSERTTISKRLTTNRVILILLGVTPKCKIQ